MWSSSASCVSLIFSSRSRIVPSPAWAPYVSKMSMPARCRCCSSLRPSASAWPMLPRTRSSASRRQCSSSEVSQHLHVLFPGPRSGGAARGLFDSTYTCEQSFSCMKLTKGKTRAQLTDSNSDFGGYSSSISPDFDTLSKSKQHQSSH